MKKRFRWSFIGVFTLLAIFLLADRMEQMHQVKLANGETVAAFANGTVYTREGMGTFDSRTLWQAEDGRIFANRPMIAGRAYFEVPLPATPKEILIWQEAMATKRDN